MQTIVLSHRCQFSTSWSLESFFLWYSGIVTAERHTILPKSVARSIWVDENHLAETLKLLRAHCA